MLLRKKLKKALALLLLISFIPTYALAENNTGKFSRVLSGETVKFDAWCFDDDAFAIMKTKIEFSDDRCSLKIDKALEEQGAKHSLKIGNLQTRIDNIKNEYASILKIKNREIERLEVAALERPNDYTIWWATGGFATGVITSVLIFLAVSK
jgi:hypothetical protein